MLHQTKFKFRRELALRKEGATKFIILHHSGVSSSHTAEDVHRWHQKRGWAGIGYHYFITKDGEVFEGRPHNTVGAHTRGHNKESIGVCFEGNFDKEELTKQQEHAAVELLTQLRNAYPQAQLRRHNNFTLNKTCPGKRFPFAWLQQHVEKIS